MTGQHATTEAGAEVPGRPARPVRFEDPARNAAYWEHVDRIVDQAPPLTNEQRARIRAAFHQPMNGDDSRGATQEPSVERNTETHCK